MGKYVHSYTSIKEYHNCPHKMHEKYIKKRFPFVETEATKFGNRMHKAFELRVGNFIPLPKEFAVHEALMQSIEDTDGRKITEEKLGITRAGEPCGFFDNDVWFRGVVDLTIQRGSEAWLYDYKSGSYKPRYITPDQLLYSTILVMAKYPSIETVYSGLLYPPEGKFWPEDGHIAYVRTKLPKYLDALRSDAAPIEEAMELGLWNKTPNPLCGYCPVRDCEHWYDARAEKHG